MRVIKDGEPRDNGPGVCIFTGTAGGDVLDTGRWIPYVDPYAYVQVSFVKEMGREVGMVEAEEVSRLRGEIAKRQRVIDDYASQIATLEKQVQAIQTVKELVDA